MQTLDKSPIPSKQICYFIVKPESGIAPTQLNLHVLYDFCKPCCNFVKYMKRRNNEDLLILIKRSFPELPDYITKQCHINSHPVTVKVPLEQQLHLGIILHPELQHIDDNETH